MKQDATESPESVSTEPAVSVDDVLPSPYVAGTQLEGSIEDFVRRCEVLIMYEQAKPLPENSIIAVLCDAVRFARETVIAQRRRVARDPSLQSETCVAFVTLHTAADWFLGCVEHGDPTWQNQAEADEATQATCELRDTLKETADLVRRIESA